MEFLSVKELFRQAREKADELGYPAVLQRQRSASFENLEDARDVHLIFTHGDWGRAREIRRTHYSRGIRDSCLSVVARHAPDEYIYHRVIEESEWQIPKFLRGLRRFRRQSLLDRIVQHWADTDQMHRLTVYLSLGSAALVAQLIDRVEPWMSQWQILKCVRRHPHLMLDRLRKELSEEVQEEKALTEMFIAKVEILQNRFPHQTMLELYDSALRITAASNLKQVTTNRQFALTFLKRTLADGQDPSDALGKLTPRQLCRLPKQELFTAVSKFSAKTDKLRSLGFSLYKSPRMRRFVEALWDLYGRDKMVDHATFLKADEIEQIPIAQREVEARKSAVSYSVRVDEASIPAYYVFFPYDEALTTLRELLNNPEADVRVSAWDAWATMVKKIGTHEVYTQYLDRALASKYDQMPVQRAFLAQIGRMDSSVWQDGDAEKMKTLILNATSASDCDSEALDLIRTLMSRLAWLHAHWIAAWEEKLTELCDFHLLHYCDLPANPSALSNENSVAVYTDLVMTKFEPAEVKDHECKSVRTEALNPMAQFIWPVLSTPQVGLPFFRRWLSADGATQLSRETLGIMLCFVQSHHVPLFEEVVMRLVNDHPHLLMLDSVAKYVFRVNPDKIFEELVRGDHDLWASGTLWQVANMLRQPMAWQDIVCANMIRHQVSSYGHESLILFAQRTRSKVLIKHQMPFEMPFDPEGGENWIHNKRWRRLVFTGVHRMDAVEALHLLGRRSIDRGDDLKEAWRREAVLLRTAMLKLSPDLAKDVASKFPFLGAAVERRVAIERRPWRLRQELMLETARLRGRARAGCLPLLRQLQGNGEIEEFLHSLTYDDAYLIKSDLGNYKRSSPRATRRRWWERITRLVYSDALQPTCRRAAVLRLTRIRHPEGYMAEFLVNYLERRRDLPHDGLDRAHLEEKLIDPTLFGRGLDEGKFMRLAGIRLLEKKTRKYSGELRKGAWERLVYQLCQACLEAANNCKFDDDRERYIAWLLPLSKRYHVLRWLGIEVILACRGDRQLQEMREFCQSVKNDRALLALFQDWQKWTNPLESVNGWKQVYLETEGVPLLHYLVDAANTQEVC